jgi:hypothetical protein
MTIRGDFWLSGRLFHFATTDPDALDAFHGPGRA